MRLFLNPDDAIKSSSLQFQLEFRGEGDRSNKVPDLGSKEGVEQHSGYFWPEQKLLHRQSRVSGNTVVMMNPTPSAPPLSLFSPQNIRTKMLVHGSAIGDEFLMHIS